MPYFLELLLFFKARYWKGRLQEKPVWAIIDKCIAAALLLLCAAQLLYCNGWVRAGATAFKNIPLGRALVLALLINTGGLFYFPGACAKSMDKGSYHVYPVSAYELNAMRIIEGLFAKTFLLSVNLLIVPVFLSCPPGAVGMAAVLATAFLLEIASVLLYDMIIYAVRAWYGWLLLAAACAAGYILLAGSPGMAGTALPTGKSGLFFSAAIVACMPVAAGILFMADAHLFARNTVNKLKHG